MKKNLIIPAICMVFIFTAVHAWGQTQPTGQGNIKLGPLEIHPSLGLMETYTDNVYKSFDGKNKERDWITTVSPGLELVLPLSRHNFRLGYLADIHRYADFKENNYVSQTANGSLNFDFPGGLLFTVSDKFMDSEVTRKWVEQPGLSGSADPYRALPFRSNDFLTKAKYSFADRWAAAAWYNNYKYSYNHEYDRNGDYDRNLFGGSVFYRFTPKTDFLVEYTHSKVDYPKSTAFDNKNDTAYVGLGFDPTAKINGYLKVGWTQKKYDVPNAQGEDKFNKFATQIDLAYNLTPYDVISLKGSRTIEEDIDTNAAYTRDYYSLGYSHILSMNEKIRLFGLVGYGMNKFEGAGTDADGTSKVRDEKLYSGTLGVDYAMRRWLTFNLSYTYTNRDSNFIRYDYKENSAFLKATISF
ncbi:MAG: outer membrane beta-barrel protein [Deltaproteobacteria bacterium]|nr:outer membrane beta-barrel protein [Deltaproteobacteria bacterium]